MQNIGLFLVMFFMHLDTNTMAVYKVAKSVKVSQPKVEALIQANNSQQNISRKLLKASEILSQKASKKRELKLRQAFTSTKTNELKQEVMHKFIDEEESVQSYNSRRLYPMYLNVPMSFNQTYVQQQQENLPRVAIAKAYVSDEESDVEDYSRFSFEPKKTFVFSDFVKKEPSRKVESKNNNFLSDKSKLFILISSIPLSYWLYKKIFKNNKDKPDSTYYKQ